MGSSWRYTLQKTWKLQMFDTKLGPMSWGWSWKKCRMSRKNLDPRGEKPRLIWSVKTTTSPSFGWGLCSVGLGTRQWMTSLAGKKPILTKTLSVFSVTTAWNPIARKDCLGQHCEGTSLKRGKNFWFKLSRNLKLKIFSQIGSLNGA